jgi:hypothetical protein
MIIAANSICLYDQVWLQMYAFNLSPHPIRRPPLLFLQFFPSRPFEPGPLVKMGVPVCKRAKNYARGRRGGFSRPFQPRPGCRHFHCCHPNPLATFLLPIQPLPPHPFLGVLMKLRLSFCVFDFSLLLTSGDDVRSD